MNKKIVLEPSIKPRQLWALIFALILAVNFTDTWAQAPKKTPPVPAAPKPVAKPITPPPPVAAKPVAAPAKPAGAKPADPKPPQKVAPTAKAADAKDPLWDTPSPPKEKPVETKDKPEEVKAADAKPAEKPKDLGSNGGPWVDDRPYAFERKKEDYNVIAIFKDKNGKEYESKPITVPKLVEKSPCKTTLVSNPEDKGDSVVFDATGSKVDCGEKEFLPEDSEITWILQCPDKADQNKTGIKVTFKKESKDCKGTVTYKPKQGPKEEKPIEVPAIEEKEKEKEKDPDAPPVPKTDAPEPKSHPQMQAPQPIPTQPINQGLAPSVLGGRQ